MSPQGPSYEQIRNSLGRYTECIDLGDFDALAALLSEARLEGPDGQLICEGKEKIHDYFARGLQLYSGIPNTKHMTVNPQIVVDEDAGTATSLSSYVVLQATPELPLQPIITGRYRDEFVRDGEGRWRFAVRRYLLDSLGDVSHHMRPRRNLQSELADAMQSSTAKADPPAS